jgi:tetratricopeptide (TPR) repeat protein
VTVRTDPFAEVTLARAAADNGNTDALVGHLSSAIRILTAEQRHREAAMVCVELGTAYAYGLGNLTASRAWYQRAERMIAEEPDCVERGWIVLAAMGCDVDDPTNLWERAEQALAISRRFGDLNLEAKALADGGLAQVRLGRITAGMALLDEAMALVCGPADDVETASKSVCSFFTACYDTADFTRASSWERAIAERNVLSPVAGGPAFLRSHCSSVRAALLCETGRWTEAERVYLEAISEFEHVMRSPAWHPAIGLADLRTRQGRFAEAETLLVGRASALEALLPMARLHLARGELSLAVATVRRGLQAVGHDRLRAAELLAIEIDALVELDDLEAARLTAESLEQVMDGLDVPSVRARVASARARVASAEERFDEAIEIVRSSLGALSATDLPWRRVLLSIELADLYDRGGRADDAAVEIALASATLADLDAELPDRHHRILDRIVGRMTSAGDLDATGPQRRPAAAEIAELRRMRSGWQARHGDVIVPLTNSKGIRYLAELIDRPAAERHALDLVDRVEGVGEVDRRALGDAGPGMDARARSAFRQRIEELRTDTDDAIAIGDLDRAEMLQAEIDQLVSGLANAFGLGGRDRRAASAAERARLNVTRAIRTAIARLGDALPEAGAALDRHVRTGTYCSYVPVDGEIRWVVSSGSFSPE